MTASKSSESSESSESVESSGAVPEDETKRRFKEALDRKKANSAGASDHKDVGGKQSRAQGPAEGRREFRRKSG